MNYRIVHDRDPMNPRTEWDNLTKVFCFHKRYNLGDVQTEICSEDYSCWAEMEAAIVKEYKPALIKRLYLMDHSGLTISTGSFGCPWDSGQVGFVFITEATVKKEKLDPEKLDEILECEVTTYDQYLRGDVHGYQIIEHCSECGSEQVKDSCWGFFGEAAAEAAAREAGGTERIQ